jgi:hypothetical protein
MSQLPVNNGTTQSVFSPLYLDRKRGFATGVPANAILDIGGVVGPGFTVGGRPLLFADGTSSNGGTASFISLQSSYESSSTANNPAVINLIAGRDLIIDSPSGPGVSFKIDSITGAVTIGGDLIVEGTHTYVNSTTTQSSNIRLSAQSVTQPALWIGPGSNDSSPTADLLLVTVVPGSMDYAALRIDSAGTTYTTTLKVLSDLTVSGKINGIDLAALSSQLTNHIFVSNSYKHLAKEINLTPGTFTNLGPGIIRSVQTVLEYLDNSINNSNAQVASLHVDVDNLQSQINGITLSEGGESQAGFTYTAHEPITEWVISHNKNTKNLMFLVFDESGFMIQPNTAQIADSNTVIMKFGAPQAGIVNMMFYAFN